MMKKLTGFLAAVLLLFGMAVSVSAADVVDQNRKGSLTVTMECDGEKLNSGSLIIYCVGHYVPADKHFVLIPELLETGIMDEPLSDAQFSEKLAELVRQKGIPGTTAPIRKGKAVFADLPVALYLVTQKETSRGYYPINPFLIVMPQSEGGKYIYDQTAEPKVTLDPRPTEPTPPTPPAETEGQTDTPSEESELPQTGQLNWPVPVMAVLGLSLLVLGLYLCYGKKNSHEH